MLRQLTAESDVSALQQLDVAVSLAEPERAPVRQSLLGNAASIRNHHPADVAGGPSTVTTFAEAPPQRWMVTARH